MNKCIDLFTIKTGLQDVATSLAGGWSQSQNPHDLEWQGRCKRERSEQVDRTVVQSLRTNLEPRGRC